MTNIAHILQRLRADRRAVTVIEFAIVAPVMLLAIMGLSDLSYRSYAQAILDGALQKAGRDSTLEGGGSRTDEIDAAVIEQVHRISNEATFTATRKSYTRFSDVERAEKYTDTNANDSYDAGECYEDLNANGQWDPNVGRDGQGGANDVVLYEMTVSYPRLFPLASMLGWPPVQEIKGMTLLKNQPYTIQNEPAVVKCA